MAKFGDIYRWTGPEAGAGRTCMMICPPHPLWSGIDLVQSDDNWWKLGQIDHTFSPQLGSDAHNWEKVECTEPKTVEPTSGKRLSSSTAPR